MDNIQELLKDATDYLSSGNVKDAYFSYISALDLVTRELHNIKFVNNVVASKPASLSSIFALSRTCLSYAEDIIVKHQTPPVPRRNPNLNIAIFPPTPQQEEHPHDLSPHRAPPIPPKPMRRSFNKVCEDGSSSNSLKNELLALKPPLPPKPVRTASIKKYLVDIEVSGSGSYLRRSESSLDVTISQTLLRRRSSSPGRVVSTSRRRPTLTGSITSSITDSPTDEESPYSSHLTSPTTPASFYGAIAVPVSMPNLFEQRPKMISVIPEGAVDPNNLVPAIALTESENAQSPSSPSSSQYSYHVPEIPASPLLTQHTQLEQKILTLEKKLSEYRDISKKREDGKSESDSDELSRTELPDEEIKEAIEKYGATVAGLKHTITKSRKLVYKAAADPDILEFAPHMIAYQLTLIESAIFLEIDPTTLLTHSAKNPDSKITASTDFFNYLTRVIERSILLPLEASSRAQIMNHWVKVAVKLHELHNFQTLKAILAALGTPPIKRLKRTWACIPKKSMVRLEALCDMMSETRNYEKYRETIQREGFLRKPTIPFLGTFIMDATYLLAAVKSAGSSISEDPRVQELLQTMIRYQHGPKYQPIPPVTFIKASTKHFRTASISAALHRSSGYKYNHRGEEEDESIEEKQQLISHYLLTRVWIPEKSVDELSLIREPHKHKNGHSGGRASGTASWSGTPNSVISNASSAYRGSTGSTVGGSGTSTGGNASPISGIGRASSTSGSGDSRPHSLEEGIDVTPTASITSKLDRAGPISDKEVELSRIHAEPTIIMPTPISSNKRTSWRNMRVMFGSYEATETPKSPTAMLRATSHSRSSSSIELVPKSPTATFMKAHGRTTSANSPGAKPFTYAPGISTPSSMGSSASAPGTRNSVGNNNNSIFIGNMDGIEDFRMVLAKKVAGEVTAGGGSLERNRQ
ncbi:17557_t:CDS:2 [Funneliformis geosporum]|uniref:17557_t:CDS:1 n=1 Tax=Funneliformis geosporum TaxID=1117311 RepID=A0A9W4SGF9_9GLOM|nr:17557_t:CDS:2 [Funneliformis geosporum]